MSPDNKAELDRALLESIDKIRDLETHYGIDPGGDPTGRALTLVLAMARDFVPGFHTKNLAFEKEKGRSRSWDVVKYCQLLADVEGLKRSKPRSDSEACRVLTTAPRYRERWGRLNKRTLENRLADARDENKNVALLFARSQSIGDRQLIDVFIESFESPNESPKTETENQ